MAVKGLNSLGLYPIDIATEILMASAHFLIKTDVTSFGLAFVILWALVMAGSIRPVWQSTAAPRVVDLFA